MSAILSTAARVATLCISLVCGVLSARLVIGDAGLAPYALLTLLIALPSLVSFSDLGAGAVVVNAVATSRDVRADEPLQRQVMTVTRVTLLFAVGVIAADVLLFVSGGWRLVLGSASSVPDSDLAAFLCVLVFSVTISLGIWQRILLGLRRNPVVILLQGLISPLSLLVVWLMLTVGGTGAHPFLAFGTFLATLTVAVTGVLVSDRMTAPLLRMVARRVLHPRRFPGVTVMDVGWPMLAQLLAAPLSLALPRFILAQSASEAELAEYALAGQVFFALQALIGAAGVTLWPSFARARAQGRIRRGPFLIALLFGTGGAVATGIALLVGPWFFGIVSDGQVEVRATTILAFGALITTQALLYPLGMFIMDRPGIRFQVAPSLLAAASTVVLTIIAAPALGVAGPLLANVVSVALIQLVPYAVYIRRHRERLYGTS